MCANDLLAVRSSGNTVHDNINDNDIKISLIQINNSEIPNLSQKKPSIT